MYTLPVFFTVTAMLLTCARVQAQGSAPPDSSRKWEITDNSFLIEEAFNQETGVVQNIFTWAREHDGAWAANFTQEWPAPGMTHQLSYTLAYLNTGEARGFGDALINYRWQLRGETARGPAISPRVSVILPVGRREDELGDGKVGLQVNLPASKQFGDLYVHANAGYTWLPSTRRVGLLGGSGIWRVSPLFNLMLEGVALLDESTIVPTLSPGFRRGWNFGEKQLVVGLAAPITWADGRSTVSVLTYLSYELPFR
jgi:hypothetical protein